MTNIFNPCAPQGEIFGVDKRGKISTLRSSALTPDSTPRQLIVADSNLNTQIIDPPPLSPRPCSSLAPGGWLPRVLNDFIFRSVAQLALARGSGGILSAPRY